MDITNKDRNEKADGNTCKEDEDNEGNGGETTKVVLRKPRNIFESSKSDSVDSTDSCCKSDECCDEDHRNKKHVKWSESTELRERLKVYRRSQLDIPLDYHHLAIEEKREREGVEVWRSHLYDKADDDDVEVGDVNNKEVQPSYTGSEDVVGPVTAGEACGGYDTITPNYDSDDTDPNIDEDLEKNLQVIKEETTRFTLYPAYSAAISVYQEWLSNPENTTNQTDDQIGAMTSQLDLYKRLVDVYREWTRPTRSNIPRESRFGEVTSILQEASSLGHPPSCVSKVIRDVLTDEENVQKQVDAYNSQVQEMIAALDITNKV